MGSFSAGFTIPDDEPVVLSGVSDYPLGGMMMFTVDNIQLLVTYDGSSTAGVSVGGVISYMIDLESGDIMPVR